MELHSKLGKQKVSNFAEEDNTAGDLSKGGN
jgi:hypothetical protein